MRPLAGEWRMLRAGLMWAIGRDAAGTDTGAGGRPFRF